MRQLYSLVGMFTIFVVSSVQAVAGDVCCPTTCAPQCEQTCWVPEWTTVTRKIQCTEYRQVQKERSITVYENVPKTETRTCTYTVYENQTKTREEKYTVCRPVWKTVEEEYTVCVPKQMTRTYEVCTYECVPKQKTVTYTVCEPVIVEREIQECVCRMVPKKV